MRERVRQPTTMKSVPIGDLVDDVPTRNPTLAGPDLPFTYIDLSAVDQEQKAIIAARQLLGADAPSRARQVVKEGDVLVSTVRPNLNGVAVVFDEHDQAIASTGFCVLRPSRGKLDSSFLFHWVRSKPFVENMIRQATGASYPAVSDGIVRKSLIPVPPLPEQRRIAAILDQADALRAKRRAALAQVDEMAQAIFVEMFGDPASNPKDWDRVTLGDVIHSATDGPHVSPVYSDSGVPFLSTRNVRKGRVIWEDLKYLSLKDAQQQWKKCKPTRGDILYTKGGTTGIAAVVDFDDEIAVWVHVALLKPKQNLVASAWLEAMLNNEFCYQQSQILTHGIANRDLGLKRMTRIEIYLPPLDRQIQFVRAAGELKKLQKSQNAHLAELDSLFASLQHRAFNGEL